MNTYENFIEEMTGIDLLTDQELDNIDKCCDYCESDILDEYYYKMDGTIICLDCYEE